MPCTGVALASVVLKSKATLATRGWRSFGSKVMRTIAETPQHERYLMVAERISPNAWRSVCESVRDYVAKTSGSNTDSALDAMRLIDSKLPPTTHPFAVLFSYADIPADTIWNLAFDPTNQSSIQSTTAVLQFGVFWQRIAQPALEHGHHQIALIDFPNGVPSLLDSLPIDANRQSYDYVGLCDSNDLRAIHTQREAVAEQSREPEHSITRQLNSKPSVRARLRQALCCQPVIHESRNLSADGGIRSA